MKKFGLLGTSALFGLSVAFAGPAYAQDTDECSSEDAAAGVCTPASADGGQAADDDGAQSVVVTGSRIRRPNLDSVVPVTSLAGEAAFQQSDTNVGETLNELPQLRSTFAQQNPGLGIGIGGLNLLDLRGLGTQRTLVLVNGRRHVAADILVNAVSPDVNSIPNDLIERIDIVTGGNSAIYGSDAIAGVINFVLRRNFEGLQVRGHAGINEEGFGGNQYVSAMYGMNFGEGAGNITVHGEYARQERVFASDIPWFRQNDGFVGIDADTTACNGLGLPTPPATTCLQNGSDGFPDAVFFRDIRGSTIHFNGLIPIAQAQGGTGPCGRGIVASNGGPANATGVPFNCNYIFTADGRLTAQTGTRVGAGPLGTFIGGNGQTGREGRTLSVLPFLERYNFNLLAHYTFSDAFEVFAEAKWNRVNALGNNAGPSFIQGQNTAFDFRERPRLDNPFLHPADRVTLTNLILTSGMDPHLNNRLALGAAGACSVATVNAGTCRFSLARNLTDVGLRDERFQRDTYRIVAGVRGTFWEDWSYEISANYGKFDQSVTTDGFIDRQRFALSMDAGLDPNTGTIRCRSQFDPAAAIQLQRGITQTQIDGNAASLAADIAACRPYNPFGQSDNTAAIDYFSRTFTAQAELDQLVLSAFVSGDTSSFFSLWGGPIRFALGLEYRREEALYQQDPFVTDGFTNGVSIPTFSPDPFEVKEAYAEVQIPILRDMPFFHELTLTGAARVADYGGGVGTVWAYNAGAEWAPIRDLRFRGNYSRAVRAPNVSETGFPLVPNFAPGFTDPCNVQNITNNATRQANCQADVGGNLGSLQAGNYSLPIVSGSNPNLVAETSDSWTLGAVFQPRFIPGFAFSVDYYNIVVNDIIATVGAQGIVNNCYDLPRPNPFCGQFTRWNGPGQGPNGEAPGAILGNSLINAPLNYAALERQGIDFNLSYRTNLSTDVRLNTNLIFTHNIKISNYLNASDPNFENRILGELGDPQNEFRFDIDLTYRQFTFGYRLRYIGAMYVGAWENHNGLNPNATSGTAPPGTNATQPGGSNADDFDVFKYPRITYSDLRFEWNLAPGGTGITDELRFYFGVDNVFNQLPPLGTTATGAGSAIYDFRGRSYYAGFRARF
jgi:outer membrane receptor protein involved in Fe transport